MKIIIIIFLTFVAGYSFAQTSTDFEKIKLEQAADYKAADAMALEASNYLLSTPFEKDNLQRLKSLS